MEPVGASHSFLYAGGRNNNYSVHFFSSDACGFIAMMAHCTFSPAVSMLHDSLLDTPEPIIQSLKLFTRLLCRRVVMILSFTCFKGKQFLSQVASFVGGLQSL